MRTKDEQRLVTIADSLICHTHLTCRFANDTHDGFGEHFDDTRIGILKSRLGRMSDQTLGFIVGAGIYTWKGLKKSAFRSTLQCMLTDPTIETDGHDALVELAEHVVIAMMYDILATEWHLRFKSSTFNGGKYRLKPAMRNFVMKHRMKQKLD